MNLNELLALAPMPAVAVSVFDREKVVYTGTRGAPDEAWWDLASVTKILVTLPEALERLDLDKPLGQQWSRAAGKPVGAATVRQLLAHNAGLPAIVPFFQTAQSRDEIVEGALSLSLEREPGGDAVYSDFGFLLLGELIQETTGRTLADLAAARTGLRFGPISGVAVPTEQCPWRGRLIVGEVHDENAYAMGGIAGHAGAFGTLRAGDPRGAGLVRGGRLEVTRCRRPTRRGSASGWAGGSATPVGSVGRTRARPPMAVPDSSATGSGWNPITATAW